MKYAALICGPLIAWAVVPLCLVLFSVSTVAAAPTCSVSLWETRLDADIIRFEQAGIKLADIELAAQQPCGGYLVSIVKGQLHALPLGWEKQPHIQQRRQRLPHVFLRMFANLLCIYPDIPDVTFVMNTYDRLCVEDRRRALPVFSWGKDVVADDAQLLMPYWTYTHLKQDVARLGTGPPWEKRIDVAIWRGTTTGGRFAAWNWQHYPRSGLVAACKDSHLCDAKFTGHPQATKEAEAAIRASRGHGSPLNMSDFLRYKYIIVNDGNMAPSSRLSIFLHSGSLLLKQETPSIEWYYDDLRPYVHYVPVSYNFGDIEQKVRWARSHDDAAQEIAERAKVYAKAFLTVEHINCYMYRLLARYAAAQRFVPGFHNATWQSVPSKCS